MDFTWTDVILELPTAHPNIVQHSSKMSDVTTLIALTYTVWVTLRILSPNKKYKLDTSPVVVMFSLDNNNYWRQLLQVLVDPILDEE
jgi:heme A synthase